MNILFSFYMAYINLKVLKCLFLPSWTIKGVNLRSISNKQFFLSCLNSIHPRTLKWIFKQLNCRFIECLTLVRKQCLTTIIMYTIYDEARFKHRIYSW
jgi:hypothetical protein